MKILKHSPSFTFTRLHAQIIEEEGAFTVSIRMHNHLKEDEKVWGQEIAVNIDMASAMIESLAKQFAISEKCITIKISMSNFKDGTIH